MEIVNAHPDWEITCLVRNEEKGSHIITAFPKVRLVFGNLDATALIEEEASQTDIVYREKVARKSKDQLLTVIQISQIVTIVQVQKR